MKLIFTKGTIFLFTSFLFLSHCKIDRDPGPINGNEIGITYAQPDNSRLPDTITLTEADANVKYEYMISLNTQPSDDVMIQISLPASSPDNLQLSSGGDTADMANESITLNFTNTDWDTSQTVTLTLINDDIALGGVDVTINHASGSSDSDYNRLNNILTVMTTDNDTPGITYSASNATLTEGSSNTAQYTVVLNSQPSDDVRIRISLPGLVPVNLQLSDGTQIADKASASITLTFTNTDWDSIQTVTLSLVDDGIVSEDGSFTIAHASTSSDSDYNSQTHSIQLMTMDNDSFEISYSISSVTVMEGGSDTSYTVVLNSQPSDDVMIQISLPANSPDNLQLSSGGNTADMPNEFINLTFTATDWNSAQTVTLTFADDDIALGDVDVTIVHASSSSDSNYNSIPVHDLMVTIQDNEMPTVTIPATLSIDEGDTRDIMISISHEPAQNVEITLTETSNEASISPGILTFTPDNWNVPKMATITIQGNDILTADRDFTVSYVASTINEMNPYHGVSISNTTVTIVEDETTCTQPGAGAETDFIPDMPGENYGAGTENDPYIICNANQLQAMRDDLDAFYELGQNIDASTVATNACPTGTTGTCTGFQPIGNCGVDNICNNADDMSFTGTLDGKGFTINDLTINMNLTSGASNAGLFGYTLGANIRNIGLLNVNISSSSSGASSFAGGLVGLNDRSSSITNSYSTGNVSSSSSSSYAGGLVGLNDNNSSITNSYSTGNVSSFNSLASSNAGGLVGENELSIIINSYSTGNVSSSASTNSNAGGLVGLNDDNGGITNSYSTGNVSSSASTNSNAGGLVGKNVISSITNSYYDQDTSTLFKNGSAVFATVVAFLLESSGTINCAFGFSSSSFKTPTAPNTVSCSLVLAIFFNWQTPFDIDGDSIADEESVRYDSNNDGSVNNMDDFVWNFGSNTEYPFIASIPQTADEQAVRMASGFLRFSNTTLGEPSSTDFVFFYDIENAATSITTSGHSVQGTTAGSYAIEDAGGNALTAPTVTNAGVINGVNSLAANSEFYLSVTFTRGTTPMASYTTRYRFKK